MIMLINIQKSMIYSAEGINAHPLILNTQFSLTWHERFIEYSP